MALLLANAPHAAIAAGLDASAAVAEGGCAGANVCAGTGRVGWGCCKLAAVTPPSELACCVVGAVAAAVAAAVPTVLE